MAPLRVIRSYCANIAVLQTVSCFKNDTSNGPRLRPSFRPHSFRARAATHSVPDTARKDDKPEGFKLGDGGGLCAENRGAFQQPGHAVSSSHGQGGLEMAPAPATAIGETPAEGVTEGVGSGRHAGPLDTAARDSTGSTESAGDSGRLSGSESGSGEGQSAGWSEESEEGSGDEGLRGGFRRRGGGTRAWHRSPGSRTQDWRSAQMREGQGKNRLWEGSRSQEATGGKLFSPPDFLSPRLRPRAGSYARPGTPSMQVSNYWRRGGAERPVAPSEGRELWQEAARQVVIELLARGRESVEEVLFLRPGAAARAAAASGQLTNPALWDKMLRELERRGNKRRAVELFDFLLLPQAFAQHGVRPTSHNFCTVLTILARDGKLGRARELLGCMLPQFGLAPRVWEYTSVLSGYAKHGLLKEAWELLEEMRAAGCEPNTVTYNVIIHVHSKEGSQIDRVIELFDEMPRLGMERDGITYNSLINACMRCGRLDKALAVFEEMEASGFAPNVVTYTSLVEGLGRAGKLMEAERLFQEMRDKGQDPNARTFNAMIRAYGDSGHLQEALTMFESMQEQGCMPNAYTYNMVINMYGREGQVEAAEAVLQRMKSQGCHPDRVTYNTLMTAYARGGHYDKALQVVELMRRSGVAPDIYSYGILLDACAKHCSLQEAVKVFQEMRNSRLQPNVVVYTAMINAYGRAGDVEGAEETWREMREAGCVPSGLSYTGLINAYARHGLHVEAQRCFEEMLRAGIDPDLRNYTLLMDAYGKAGEWRRSEAVLSQMRAAGFVPDVLAYAVLVRAFALVDRFELALEYFERVLAEGDDSRPLCKQLKSDFGELYSHYTGKPAEWGSVGASQREPRHIDLHPA